MPAPLRLLILGAGPLTAAIRPLAGPGGRFDLGRYGAPGCSVLGQMRQVLEVWLGRTEIPEDIQALCVAARLVRATPGPVFFREVDVAALEPVSDVDLIFRGRHLSAPALSKQILAPIRAAGPEAADAADRWLSDGLLAIDEEARAQAADELLRLVPPDPPGALTRAVIAETRSRLGDAEAALRAIAALLDRPTCVVAASPADNGFAGRLAQAAASADLPLFQPPAEPAARGDRFADFAANLARSGAAPAAPPLDLSPAPFFKDYVLTRAREETIRATLAARGVRPLPFPFGSAMAIVSDLDGSGRRQYDAYTDQLVGRFGLDFGDSTWLQWHQASDLGSGTGFGFFTPGLTVGHGEPGRMFAFSRTFFESIAEYHKGNLDHFHAFSATGPRVVVAAAHRPAGRRRVAFDLGGAPLSGVDRFWDFRVLAVCVVGKKNAAPRVRAVALEAADGALTDDYGRAAFDAPADGRRYDLFCLARPPGDDRPVPTFKGTGRLLVEFEATADRDDVERVLIANTFGTVVLDRLEFLRRIYNVDVNLVTEHGAHHFRNPARGDYDDRLLRRHARDHHGDMIFGGGTLIDDDGDLVFSTDADHPHSLCRVLPAMVADLDVRFIVPAAATGVMGFSPFELVTPSPTRAGGGVYWAKRVKPMPEGVAPGGPFDKSRQSTFAVRLERVFELAGRAPGLFWPIYTHLGALDGNLVPAPYFDEATLSTLQDRAFNVSGAVPPASRLWVGRPSALYDYALMLRSLGEHVTRPGPDTVAIASWLDPVLGKRLPRSKGQLYGLTFYVDDPAGAEVRLDGEPIETLFRNPPDDTGRPSVTIAECAIRHTLFDSLDPMVDRPGEARLAGGEWTWSRRGGGDRAFGRLTVSAPVPKAGGASLTIPLRGWAAAGAQLASFAIRPHRDSRFAVEFETVSGGRFCFGDRAFVEARAAGFTASYAFDCRLFSPGAWRSLAVPFHDLAWNPRARPGGPLPSHPLGSMTIHCIGDGGAAIDVAGLAFLRPRAAATASEGAGGFCLGGRLETFIGGDIVHLAALDSPPSDRREMAVDQRGFFCFDRVAPGVYEVWADTPSGPAHDRRGPRVEVAADIMTLVLGAAPPVPDASTRR